VSEGTIRYETVREIRGVSIDEEKEGDFGILCGGGQMSGSRMSYILVDRPPSRAPPPSPVPIVGRDDDEVAGQAA